MYLGGCRCVAERGSLKVAVAKPRKKLIRIGAVKKRGILGRAYYIAYNLKTE